MDSLNYEFITIILLAIFAIFIAIATIYSAMKILFRGLFCKNPHKDKISKWASIITVIIAAIFLSQRIDYLFYGLFALIALGITASAITIAYYTGKFLFKWLFRSNKNKDRISKRAGMAAAIIVATYIGYLTYEDVYPPDSFYLKEFRAVTQRPAPASAEVLSKAASYPSPHGDYCSFSRIKLSQKDFEDLLKYISSDTNFKTDSIIGSSEENEVLKSLPSIPKFREFTRPEEGHPDHYFGIRFLNSREHVEVSVCIT